MMLIRLVLEINGSTHPHTNFRVMQKRLLISHQFRVQLEGNALLCRLHERKTHTIVQICLPYKQTNTHQKIHKN
jgi:hypothetical protein